MPERSTGYKEYRAGEVRNLVRGTADFPSTVLRRVPYSWGTNFSTGYGYFPQHGVRGVRSTKGTKVRMSVPELDAKVQTFFEYFRVNMASGYRTSVEAMEIIRQCGDEIRSGTGI